MHRIAGRLTAANELYIAPVTSPSLSLYKLLVMNITEPVICSITLVCSGVLCVQRNLVLLSVCLLK